MRWRILLTAPMPGADNMAMDEALMERARTTGETTCRVYTWSQPTLSLGRNQTAAGRYDLELAARLGVGVVRRPTGGRAVLHHRELTYSVAGPAPATGSLRQSYAAINLLLHDALARLGAEVRDATPTSRAPTPSMAPCFELPTRDELLLDGRKLVGSAQWRDEGAFLQHGSILIDDDQQLIARLSREATAPALAPAAPALAPATLRGALGRAPEPGELAAALLDAVRTREDPEAAWWEPDDALGDATRRLRARYLDDAWTWRR